MNHMGVKTIFFGSYLMAILLTWVFPIVNGFAAWTIKLVLIYCGLIVGAHLLLTMLLLGKRIYLCLQSAFGQVTGITSVESEGA